MANFDDVVATTAGWPGVARGTWYGTDGIKVGGKGFCRMWSQREHDRDDVHDVEVLVVMCDPDEKQALLDAHESVLFSTPHYDGHGAMLVRLGDVNHDDLAGFLEGSYRTKAKPKLLAEFDASYE